MRNILLLCLLIWQIPAVFACSVSGAKISDISVNMNKIALHSQLRAGDIIAVEKVTLNPGSHWTIDCNSTPGNDALLFSTHLSLYGNNIFKTNISGIGIRLSVSTDSPIIQNKSTHYIPERVKIDKSGTIHPNEVKLNIELIRTTDHLASGELNILLPDFITLLSGETKTVLPLSSLSIKGQVAMPTCSWVSATTQINLGDFTLAEFHKKHALSVTQEKDFSLAINCPGVPDINVTLRGNTHGNSKDILAVRNTPNSAQGVGLQILYDKDVVSLNEKLHITTEKDEESNNVLIPFSARLIRTGDSLKAGDIISTATFDLSYE